MTPGMFSKKKGLYKLNDMLKTLGGGGNTGGEDKKKKGSSNTNPTDTNNGWEMTEDVPSPTRQGYRRATFKNSTALPQPDYKDLVTRQQFEQNSGPFTDPNLDFPLNQARSAFEDSPSTYAVRLGRASAVKEGTNPTYPLTERYSEYRENPMPQMGDVKSFPVRGVSPFSIPGRASILKRPVDNTIVPRTNLFTQDNQALADMNHIVLPKKGQSPRLGYADGGRMHTGEFGDSTNFMFSDGGSIHIKPSHKGRFTEWKKRTGKTTEQALHDSDPHVRQMANFARNAANWYHREGGLIGGLGKGENNLFRADVAFNDPSFDANYGSVYNDQRGDAFKDIMAAYYNPYRRKTKFSR